MTTDHDLLARIDEAITTCTRAINFFSEVLELENVKAFTRELSAWKALRAVVEREPLLRSRFDNESNDEAQRVGYNQCLADIKADIKKELG